MHGNVALQDLTPAMLITILGMIKPTAVQPQIRPFRLTPGWKYVPPSGSHLIGQGSYCGFQLLGVEMAKMHILKALSYWLFAHNNSQPEIDRYAAVWSKLRAHDSLPCPKCYFDEPAETQMQPLIALSKEGQFEPLFCVHCKTKFIVEIPG